MNVFANQPSLTTQWESSDETKKDSTERNAWNMYDATRMGESCKL